MILYYKYIFQKYRKEIIFKMKKTSFYILIALIIITTMINLILFSKILQSNSKNNKEASLESNTEETIQEKSEEDIAKEELESLQKMTERDRMEYYFSKFIKYIKNKKYTDAYNLLYPEFRENYFKTQEEFKEYAKKTYPSSVGFSYNDIERQGSIYVLVITVIDTNKNKGEERTQRIVIKENDFNDFVISFQVI